MALPGTIQDREHSKFVESPTRPGQTAIEVVQVGGGGSTSTTSTPTIQNISLTDSETEYEIDLESNLVACYFKSRTISRLQISFEIGGTLSNFITVPLGGFFEIARKIDATKLYVKSDRPNITLEVIKYLQS